MKMTDNYRLLSPALEFPPGYMVMFFNNIGKFIINNYCVRSKSKSADILSTALHKIFKNNSTIQNQIN